MFQNYLGKYALQHLNPEHLNNKPEKVAPRKYIVLDVN